MISENALSYLIYYCSLYNQRGLIAKNSTWIPGFVRSFFSYQNVSVVDQVCRNVFVSNFYQTLSNQDSEILVCLYHVTLAMISQFSASKHRPKTITNLGCLRLATHSRAASKGKGKQETIIFLLLTSATEKFKPEKNLQEIILPKID